ncbi:hypothetical protein [Sedimenticola selenatireducens]|uniref:hypothetical protein n=1 Tax=Sedimenticola selenatireducens TaxID=191960 RepID=UPI002AAB8303|nr:hypothetical protein [Sedimenticola selenatireducens]
MKTQQTLVILATLLLTGCVTTDDPREGGFFGGVHGISSGSYERRAQEREENLAKVRAMQKELEAETESLDAQKHQRQLVLEQEQSKLATLNSDVKALEARLMTLGKEQGASDKRVADLQRRLDVLKGQLSKQQTSLDALEGGGTGGADALEGTGTGALGDTRRQQLEAQRLELQKEYDSLLSLTLMLAE